MAGDVLEFEVKVTVRIQAIGERGYEASVTMATPNQSRVSVRRGAGPDEAMAQALGYAMDAFSVTKEEFHARG